LKIACGAQPSASQREAVGSAARLVLADVAGGRIQAADSIRRLLGEPDGAVARLDQRMRAAAALARLEFRDLAGRRIQAADGAVAVAV